MSLGNGDVVPLDFPLMIRSDNVKFAMATNSHAANLSADESGPVDSVTSSSTKNLDDPQASLG